MNDQAALTPVFSRNTHRGADGSMSIAGHDVRDLAREFGTPAYLVDVDDARSRAREYRDEFARAFEGIGTVCDVFYAGKAFLSVAMAKLVREEGLHLDVCSGGELAVAIRAGVPGELIGMHGNNKSVAEIDAALAHGVGRIVVDSFEEIERVADAAARAGATAKVMLRVKTGVEAHTHEFIATAHEDQKFGFGLETQVGEAVRRVLAREELQLLGFHSHIGSQIFESDGFAVAAERLIGLQLAVAKEHGVTLPELDLGGGFGIAYLPSDVPLAPSVMADQLASIVQKACTAAGTEIPRISIEPGRSVIGPAGMTLYTVGTVKQVVVDDELSRTYVAVDGGMSDNPRPVLYDAEYHCEVVNRSAEPATQSRVVGKHCESGDIVVRDVLLPNDIRADDLVLVAATGAYCRSLSSTYNHVPRPPVIAVEEAGARPWIRRETIEDLLLLESE
ncbi:diaminopimelate decarboxylase [Yimella sp. cx-51]|uniref:diaminopimelate decarboxylase n=1 Tax=Yimella sp. cx-51 TaxID=2770551 RepID=UPI00165DE9A6|nr:diaminopimelate decarboxylase [Yimella sp. cx-51]MBC9957006.1 diaminopimelate decarboxylase [Yimella sp. cx-51]QTH37325.1 diaminopimelate decarboxylase [Yimella sp. cx-51]